MSFRHGKCAMTLVFLLASMFAFGQIDIPKEVHAARPGKMKHLAEHSFKMGDPYTALFYYELVVKKHPDDVEAHYQLAELHRITRNYSEAEKHYLEVYNKSPEKYPFVLYYEAVMQKMQGKYEEAEKNLTKFRKSGRSLGDKQFQKHVRKEIQGCRDGMSFVEFPNNYSVVNAGNEINHPHAEFSPLVIDSTKMIFGSLREDSLHYYDVSFEHQDVQPKRKLYFAEKMNNHWETTEELSLLKENLHLGKIAYSSLTYTYYFTGCEQSAKTGVRCDLYTAKVENGKIGEIEKMPSPVNGLGINTTQPAVRMDTARKMDLLYFASERPGGQGGLDIYYTYYQKRQKRWKEPRNMGRLINTPDTDCSPYFDNYTGSLFFSSDGHATMGGLDVFQSRFIDKRFQRPINVGAPINSPQDDLDFVLGSDTTSGFVVSNRPGGTPYFHETCCDDIWEFKALPPKPFNCDLALSVSGEADTIPSDFQIVLATEDLKTHKITMDTLTLEDGRLNFPLDKDRRYTFRYKGSGIVTDSLEFVTGHNAKTNSVSRVIELEKDEPEILVIPDEIPTEDKPFVLKNVQYEYGSSELTPQAKRIVELSLVPYLKKHQDYSVVILSHTDNVGSKRYNQDLSQKRAQNVVDLLVSMGIEKSRLEAKGFGESKPIAPNELSDGSDNPAGRSLNRRTEFSVVKE